MARRILACALLTAALVPSSAIAAPDCKQMPTSVRYLAREQGMLESVKVDPNGRLVFSVSQDGPVLPNGLMRIDRPGATPTPLAAIASPGGIAVAGRSLIV